MKKISIIVCILIWSNFVFGQNDLQTSPTWQQFSPKGEQFSVEFPLFPKSQSFSKDNSSRRYFCQSDQTYLFIFVEERKTQAQNNLWQLKNVLSFVYEFQIQSIKGKFGNDEAEKYEMVDSEGYFHTVIIVKTFDFVLIFQTISQTKNDSIAQRFLSSIKIKDNSSTLVEMTQKTSQERTTEITPPKENVKNESVGKGVGSGSLNEIGGSEPSKTEPNQSKGLVIKSKSKPPYTDYARFYLIEGSILLRVTFLADGKIGSISPVTKLPFGLTQNAIEAAKKVIFEPAIKNGVPYTVVKTLQYTFTMY